MAPAWDKVGASKPRRVKAKLLELTGRTGDCQAVASWVVRKIAAQWGLTPGSIDASTPFSDWVGDATGFADDFNHASGSWAPWHGVTIDSTVFAAAVAGKTVDQAIDLLCEEVAQAKAAA